MDMNITLAKYIISLVSITPFEIFIKCEFAPIYSIMGAKAPGMKKSNLSIIVNKKQIAAPIINATI